MVVSFLESFKYIGHFYPIAFLRVYLGFFYLEQALSKWNGDFIREPILTEMIGQWMESSSAPLWYQSLANSYFSEYWQSLSYTFTVLEFLVGISFILGYLVRPLGIVAAILALNFLWFSNPDQGLLYKTLIATNISLAWIGAGRCFGIDYYFYKKVRGWMW
ncbi:MAG: DoxX family membrane protein [Bdellovibrionales bacterium]